MTTSHEAAVAVANAFSGRTDLGEEEIEKFYVETLPTFPEAKRELIFDWILCSVDEIRAGDVDALMERVKRMDAEGVPA